MKLCKLMLSGSTPRLIAFVASRDENGVGNLAPYSWFNMHRNSAQSRRTGVGKSAPHRVLAYPRSWQAKKHGREHQEDWKRGTARLHGEYYQRMVPRTGEFVCR